MIQISFRTQDFNIRQAQSGIRAKNYSWSMIHSVFKIRQSVRFTAKIHKCDFWGQIRRSENLFTPSKVTNHHPTNEWIFCRISCNLFPRQVMLLLFFGECANDSKYLRVLLINLEFSCYTQLYCAGRNSSVRSFGADLDQDQWSKHPRSVWIMVHQRNRRIHSGHGFTGSFDEQWSRQILDHWSWSRSPQMNVLQF